MCESSVSFLCHLLSVCKWAAPPSFPNLIFTDPESNYLQSDLLRSYNMGSAVLHAVSANTKLLRISVRDGAYNLG